MVLQRQPDPHHAWQPEGAYTSTLAIICCDCGDHPRLDCREVSPELQRVREPYAIASGMEAFVKHARLAPQLTGDPPVGDGSYVAERRGGPLAHQAKRMFLVGRRLDAVGLGS